MRLRIDGSRRFASVLMALACFSVLVAAAPAAVRPTADVLGRELVVGTRVSPPFAMKNDDGTWEGISIDLWRHLAEPLHLRYRIEDRGSVQDLLAAVASGQVDVAVAALTVTSERRKVMDFAQPFFLTGLGVAVPRTGVMAWLPVVRTFLSFRFLQAVLALLGIALFVGTLIWIFERHENEHYGGGPMRGFVAGAWWSVDFLTEQRIGFRAYPTAAAGLRAAQSGQIDAFVYDRPLLAWILRQDFPQLDLTPVTLDVQNYAFALPLNSALREALDVGTLETLKSGWWEQTRFRYLGRDSTN